MCVVWVGMVVTSTRVGFAMLHVCPCDPCDRVSRVSLVCPGSPRCLSLPVPVLFFTGTFTGVSRLPPVSLNRYRYCTGCVSRLPPVSLNLVPRCLFTGIGVLSVVEIWSYSTVPVQSRLPPVSFYRYSTVGCARAWGWLRECGGRGVCVRVNVRCVWLRSCAAVLRVIVCLSSLCVGSGSRVCPVRG